MALRLVQGDKKAFFVNRPQIISLPHEKMVIVIIEAEYSHLWSREKTPCARNTHNTC